MSSWQPSNGFYFIDHLSAPDAWLFRYKPARAPLSHAAEKELQPGEASLPPAHT